MTRSCTTIGTAALAATLVALAAFGCGRDEVGPAAPSTTPDPTATDVWLVPMTADADGIDLGTPVNATDRAGYDNQPFFIAADVFLYTSIGRDGQADIWRYELDRRRPFRVTRTPESEFSPTPLADGGFAVVRVESDERQRLWRFNADGEPVAPLLESVEPVGYQAWVDPTTVALFILGEPPTLVVASIEEGTAREVLRSIGRSVRRIPGKAAVSVVHKVNETEWNIVELDPTAEAPTVIAPALVPAEDHAWTPDGRLLMAAGAAILVWDGDAGEWRTLADFADRGVGAISRIAVSPDGAHIAFVAQR